MHSSLVLVVRRYHLHIQATILQEEILKSNTIPLSQNPFQYHLSPLFPLHGDPYLNLSPTYRAGNGGVFSICFLLPQPSCVELLWPADMHLEELEGSVLTCCNAEQLLPLLHINLSDQHTTSSTELETLVLQAGMMTVMFQISNLDSLQVHSWEPRKY